MKKLILLCSLLSAICSAQELKVMTYNIRYDNPGDGINSWTEGNRREKALTIMAEQTPDILGVQEALHNQVQDIELHFPNYYRIGVGRDDGDMAGEYAALFIHKDRFDLLDSGNFWFSETPEEPSKGWDAKCCNRICSWAKLRYQGKTLFAFNMHFDHEGVVAQRESAHLILKKIKEIAKNAPVIIMGDLNMTPDNPAIALIARKMHNTRQIATEELKHKGTFNAFKINEPLRGAIDYIFIKGKIKATHFDIIDKKIDGLYPSDHLPVVATLKM